MSKQIEAMKLALEALQTAYFVVEDDMLADEIQQAITALREALADTAGAAEQPRAGGTLAQQSAERGKPKPIGRPHRAVMGDYGAKLVNQRIEAVVDAERKMQAKTAETRADTGVDGGGRQPAQQDIPDLIAGALGVSRGTAYDMMREALAEQQEPVAGQGKELSERLKLCARNVAFVAAGRVDMSSAAMQEMFALIDHVCVGLDSPQAQPRGEATLAREPLTDERILSCPYDNSDMRSAFSEGWLKAEAAHGITGSKT